MDLGFDSVKMRNLPCSVRSEIGRASLFFPFLSFLLSPQRQGLTRKPHLTENSPAHTSAQPAELHSTHSLTLQLSERLLENTRQTLHWLPATLGTKPQVPARSHRAASQLHHKSLEPRWLCTWLRPVHQCPLCWNTLFPTLCTHFSSSAHTFSEN